MPEHTASAARHHPRHVQDVKLALARFSVRVHAQEVQRQGLQQESGPVRRGAAPVGREGRGAGVLVL